MNARRSITCSARLIALIALAACNDPPFPVVPDGSGPTDRNPGAADRRCWTVGSGGSAGWNCLQIGECAKGCGTHVDCIAACKNQGCPDAKTAFDNDSTCVQNMCLGSCLGGFSDDCWACAKAKCPTQTAACEQQVCGGGSEVVVCSETGVGPSPPDGPSGGSDSCATMRKCVNGCLLTSCVSTCRETGCVAGLFALNDLFNCARAQCSFECTALFDYPLLGSLLCKPCVEMKCLQEITACDSKQC